jgi:hypothetical protein
MALFAGASRKMENNKRRQWGNLAGEKAQDAVTSKARTLPRYPTTASNPGKNGHCSKKTFKLLRTFWGAARPG